MFCYGILLTKKPLGYVQYNLLRNRSKRSISELKQSIIQRDILELWEPQAAEENCQSYMLLIGNDLKIWHDAGIHFWIFRYCFDSDWEEVADFSTPCADGLNSWNQESDRISQVEAALQNIMSGRRDPDDLKLMSGVLDTSLPDDPAVTIRQLSEAFPFQSVDDRGELAAMLQDDELRRFFVKSTDGSEGRSGGNSDENKAKHSGTKRGGWLGFMSLFKRKV